MAENYETLLNQSWGEIPEPKTLPPGSWLLKGRNASYMPPKGESSARVLFFYTPKSPMDDVDESALNGLGANYDIEDNDIVATFWVEKKKDWAKVRNHLKKHGIEPANDVPISETLKAFKGTEVIAYLETKVYTNQQGEAEEQNNPTNFTPIG